MKDMPNCWIYLEGARWNAFLNRLQEPELSRLEEMMFMICANPINEIYVTSFFTYTFWMIAC